jgi:hypothetical protein
MDCICQQQQLLPMGELSLLDSFSAVRQKCPAIREVFVPDHIWPKFHAWHLKPDNEADHVSTLLLALERGHLGSFTSSAHRYLIKSGCLNPEVRTQYVQDLREQWMNYQDPMERHRKFKIFSGRFVELRCAEWLEQQSWTVTELEAFREGPDIVAMAMNRDTTAFEVKFIGQDEAGFETVLKSISGKPAAMTLSPYDAVNYVLYRAYEAAKQLQQTNVPGRIAIIVIDQLTWFTFEMPLKDGWIDWKNPAFLKGNGSFVHERRKKNPKLDAELKTVFSAIDAVWIVKRCYGNLYVREFDLSV